MIDQYQIPDLPQHTPQSFMGEAFGLSPEIPAAPYAFIKPIEQKIESLRSNADESVLIRNRISHIFRPVLKQIVKPVTGVSLERRLVDCESELGGALFPQLPGIISQRFWYHQNDWFYEQTDQQGSMTARYQVHPESIAKLVDGRFAELHQQEKDHLLATIPRYYGVLKSDLYGEDDVVLLEHLAASELRQSDFDTAA